MCHYTRRCDSAVGEILMMEWNISEEAASLHRDAIVWDMTIPLTGNESLPIREDILQAIVDGGYTYVSFSLATDWHNLDQAVHALSRRRAYFLAESEKYVVIDTVDDVARAKKEGKLGVSFNFQGTNPIDADIEMVETYYKLGVRHMLMAYNIKNIAGDGCMERTDDGLSRFGVAVVEEMNRVGMIIDAAHTDYRTTMDMFEVSKEPVIFSHSNPAALWNIPRSIRDDLIKACATSGGVIALSGVGIFLGDNDASTEMLLDHIDYVAKLVGPEHTGIGTDWVHQKERRVDVPSAAHPLQIHQDAHFKASGGKSRAPSWDKIDYVAPTQLPELTDNMLKRGYTEKEIRGVLGENMMGVAKQVWK